MHNDEPDTSAPETYTQLAMDDIPMVVALECQCFSTPWTEKQYEALVEAKVCFLFGVRRAADLLAYIAISLPPGSDIMEVYNIAVTPAERGRGIGKRLLRLAMDASAKAGAERVVLEVRPSNTPAIALYTALGFERCGVRRAYYQDTGEDALIYVVPLRGL